MHCLPAQKTLHSKYMNWDRLGEVVLKRQSLYVEYNSKLKLKFNGGLTGIYCLHSNAAVGALRIRNWDIAEPNAEAADEEAGRVYKACSKPGKPSKTKLHSSRELRLVCLGHVARLDKTQYVLWHIGCVVLRFTKEIRQPSARSTSM